MPPFRFVISTWARAESVVSSISARIIRPIFSQPPLFAASPAPDVLSRRAAMLPSPLTGVKSYWMSSVAVLHRSPPAPETVHCPVAGSYLVSPAILGVVISACIHPAGAPATGCEGMVAACAARGALAARASAPASTRRRLYLPRCIVSLSLLLTTDGRGCQNRCGRWRPQI